MPQVDVSMLGDEALSRKLHRMPDKLQQKIVKGELRKSANRARTALRKAVAGGKLGVATGRTAAAFMTVRPRLLKRSRGSIGYGIAFPDREALGISAEDQWFYPAALEYGTKVRKGRGKIEELRYIRNTIDEITAAEHAKLRIDIGGAIEREWRRG